MKMKRTMIVTTALAIIAIPVAAAIFSNANDKQDTTMGVVSLDPEYSAKISEEDRRINELINASIYKEIENSIEEYGPFGITYDVKLNQLYHNGEPIKYFADNLATDGSFEGTELHCNNGDIGIVTVRDENGIKELKQLSNDDLQGFLNQSWKDK